MNRSSFAATALAIHFWTAGIAVAEPLCGDVNDSGGVNATDALLVLRKGVGLNVTIPCNGYADALNAWMEDYAQCSSDLSDCQDASACGNGVVDPGENCDFGTIGGQDCQSVGLGEGPLDCAVGCTLDTSACSGSDPGPCEPNPCQHGGSCFEDGLGIECVCNGDWEGSTCGTCNTFVEACSSSIEAFRALFLFCAGAGGFKCEGAESDTGDCLAFCQSYIGCEGTLDVNADGWTTVTGTYEPNCPP
jgi:hypothetical protein